MFYNKVHYCHGIENPFLDFQLGKFNLLYQRIIICDIELAQGNSLCYKRWLGCVDWSINELLKTI